MLKRNVKYEGGTVEGVYVRVCTLCVCVQVLGFQNASGTLFLARSTYVHGYLYRAAFCRFCKVY